MTAAERAGDRLTGWVLRLPPRLRRYLPRELAGFAMLGAFTFTVDLVLLTLLRHFTHLRFPVAVSIAYLTAFALNFLLNRTVNFRSHAPVGRQALRYTVVAVGDYAITVGVTSGLFHMGLDGRVARLIAATFVAGFTYSASRWWVFRDRPAPAATVAAADATASPAAPVAARD
ncbi:GtrA family protein [Dactylosporangium vinaceum]|uniref:GtrA family protein n=1 Tax=Dactylosporangium vinaceum TaxID=53362 RepID=A0ABV5MKE2_9ACTN|nr:GtrA family protein [Dactylosporangium vinaceum]UAB94108.1 GtrA family protein [Dactylosporangium vinaceum]